MALLVVVAMPAAAVPRHRDALAVGRTAYERGDYARAIATIRPLLYPTIELGTEEEVVQAHRLLALSYFFVDEPKRAEEEFISLLALRPNYALDPIVDPPLAVRFFEEVKRRQGERLKAIQAREREERERRQREEERQRAQARARAERVYVDRVVERHSRLVAALPFGIGQAQNGQTGKAIAFGVAEGALGLTSLAAFLAIQYKYPVNPTTLHRQFPADEARTATALVGLQLAAGAAFWATVVWGILDAELLFKREVVTHTREREAPAPKARAKLTVMPAGLGLWGTF